MTSIKASTCVLCCTLQRIVHGIVWYSRQKMFSHSSSLLCKQDHNTTDIQPPISVSHCQLSSQLAEGAYLRSQRKFTPELRTRPRFPLGPASTSTWLKLPQGSCLWLGFSLGCPAIMANFSPLLEQIGWHQHFLLEKFGEVVSGAISSVGNILIDLSIAL